MNSVRGAALVLALAANVGAFAPTSGLVQPRNRALHRRASSDEGDVFQSKTFYEDKLCPPEEGRQSDDECLLPGEDEFVVGVLGDLHMDPRVLEDYEVGRGHFIPIFEDATKRGVNAALVSLGDVGESKPVTPDTQELFAGTTACHELASEFLSSFTVPYEIVGGNHDLEGIDEFATDQENLDMYLRVHAKDGPMFKREIAEKTLLVGMGSTVFRDAKYTSHEVTIDDEQVAWFENLVETHPAEEGWKIFVFTHAPPIGSGLRVLQNNHVVNGCCWLNHSGDNARKFIDLVRKHRCIKAWFSGHFHLGQDYQDSITFPSAMDGTDEDPNRGSCVFAQTSVMRSGTSRDKRQQSRLIRGNKNGFEICTVNHADGGKIRLDATITYTDSNHEVGVYAHGHDELASDQFMRVYSPSEGDASYVPSTADGTIDCTGGKPVDENTIAWWKMACGRVLGVYDRRLIEYDPSTLSPLGLVVGQDELTGCKVFVVPSGEDANCDVSDQVGMEGADCVGGDVAATEQAVILVNDKVGSVIVAQPNEDGSYWRKIVRNKITRMKEKRRMQAASGIYGEDFKVVSSWGPYTQISGTAKNTRVIGMSKTN